MISSGYMQILMLLEMLCGFTILSHSSIFPVLGSSPSGDTFYTFCEAAPGAVPTIPRNESRFAPRSRGIKTGHIGHRSRSVLIELPLCNGSSSGMAARKDVHDVRSVPVWFSDGFLLEVYVKPTMIKYKAIQPNWLKVLPHTAKWQEWMSLPHVSLSQIFKSRRNTVTCSCYNFHTFPCENLALVSVTKTRSIDYVVECSQEIWTVSNQACLITMAFFTKYGVSEITTCIP